MSRVATVTWSRTPLLSRSVTGCVTATSAAAAPPTSTGVMLVPRGKTISLWFAQAFFWKSETTTTSRAAASDAEMICEASLSAGSYLRPFVAELRGGDRGRRRDPAVAIGSLATIASSSNSTIVARSVPESARTVLRAAACARFQWSA